MTNLTDTVRLASLTAVVTLSVGAADLLAAGVPPNTRIDGAKALKAAATGKPSTSVDTVVGTVVIPAGTLWDSGTRLGEQCAFDVEVRFNQTFKTTDFGDRAIQQIQINDVYTNLATGFTFVDRARFSINVDKVSGFAYLHGTFWQNNVEGGGIEVHDVGRMVQDLNLPGFVIIEKHGTFDVNAVPFGTLSYCDWLQGIWP